MTQTNPDTATINPDLPSPETIARLTHPAPPRQPPPRQRAYNRRRSLKGLHGNDYSREYQTLRRRELAFRRSSAKRHAEWVARQKAQGKR